MLAVTESQEAQGLLDEIQQQPRAFVLSGPAIVITNVATASALLAEGWSTESVSRVVRTARTRKENNEKERAEHAYCSHMHDEVTISDTFPATVQGLDEGKHLAENTIREDDQEDETEQSLTNSLQTREFMKTSNRTLVQVLRLGGAKRRIILAAAKHSCGACEAQKRPAGPIIVSRSPNSFVFNVVVGLDLFFLEHVRKAHVSCHGHGVLGYWSATCHSPAVSVGRNLRNAYRNSWLRSYGRPRILVVDQQRSLCFGIFAEKVESDGTRMKVTPMGAPWWNGKTERAGKDWKEDWYKTTQDGPEAQT